MRTIISSGLGERDAWREIYEAMNTKIRLSESERKRLVQMEQMISSEEALTLLGAVVASIKRHVTDEQVLRAISAEITGLVSSTTRRSSRPVSSGGQSSVEQARASRVDPDTLLDPRDSGPSYAGAISAEDAQNSVIEGSTRVL